MTVASSCCSSGNSQTVSAARGSAAASSAGTHGRTVAIAVCVDDCRVPWRGNEWSHADTTEELHAFAVLLGLHRRRLHHKSLRPWKGLR